MPKTEVLQKQLDVKFSVKSVNDETGEFEGYASTFAMDSDNERIAKGAWTRTLSKSHTGGVVPILFAHDTKEPCGWNQEAREDEHGLWVKGRLHMATEIGKKAYYFLKGALEVGGRAGLSVGFRILKDHWEKDPDDPKKQHRVFDECVLMEYSVVVFAANTESFVTQVKAQYEQEIAEHEPETQHRISDGPEAAEITNLKDAATMAHTDFSTALAAEQERRDTSQQREDIGNALNKSLASIHDDDADDEAKKVAVRKAYMDHGSAMGDWHVKAFLSGKPATTDTPMNESLRAYAATDQTFVTKKSRLSAVGKARMEHALAFHKSAMDLQQKGMDICKSMMIDKDDSSMDMGDEMGAMSEEPVLETKAADEIVDPIEQEMETPEDFFSSLPAFDLSAA